MPVKGFFRPSGAPCRTRLFPWLAPWATFSRPSGADAPERYQQNVETPDRGEARTGETRGAEPRGQTGLSTRRQKAPPWDSLVCPLPQGFQVLAGGGVDQHGEVGGAGGFEIGRA